MSACWSAIAGDTPSKAAAIRYLLMVIGLLTPFDGQAFGGPQHVGKRVRATIVDHDAVARGAAWMVVGHLRMCRGSSTSNARQRSRPWPDHNRRTARLNRRQHDG